MDAEFETLKRLEAVSSAAEATFAGAAGAKEMDPAATADARTAEAEAAENAQVCSARARSPYPIVPSRTTLPYLALKVTCGLGVMLLNKPDSPWTCSQAVQALVRRHGSVH